MVKGWWAASHFLSSSFRQFQAVAEQETQNAECLVGNSDLVSDEQHEVTSLCARFGFDGFHFFGFDELLGRAFHALGGQCQRSEAFCTLFFGNGG
jgi:hypothetical protein